MPDQSATDEAGERAAPRTGGAADAVAALVDAFAARRPLRAGAFIVTLYGDVVVPRGGSLWVGHVIEACARVGISETLVRTAASRLVAAGRLEGTRVGRLGYYGLTAAAHEEFAAAADRLYALPRDGSGPATFTLALQAGSAAGEPPDRASGFVPLAPGVALAAGHRPVPAGWAGLTAASDDLQGHDSLRAAVRQVWALDDLEAGYAAFIDRFSCLSDLLAAGDRLADGLTALSARLLLVHGFRALALRDPDLPPAALPQDWAGDRARRLFARLYLALSPAADAQVSSFTGLEGALEAVTPGVRARHARLGG
ncbi:PaaX family transcriptional regulator C-terminal domain-containing protein [Pannonibacter tanglangensis]|uniref:PaaX family transcriptional regulator n=1 Tax=Pannonibacter tanglangensis TaxID=2750084 RepID=A0ABW9ZGY8_9HYPH|nr:PaaX family transcriptional regulator C-terminal domain-containing protein [Pannonibacter sp. XCT-34]NBN62297.1 PaaX family transcriptional regulator [Pannonibacter sp. XCT-34]